MPTCCCSLAGTGACKTCANGPGYEWNYWGEWRVPPPISPTPPWFEKPWYEIHKTSGLGWICPKCGRVWGPDFIGPCTCFKQSEVKITPTDGGPNL